MPIGDIARRNARRLRATEAVRHGRWSIAWGELDLATNRLSNALLGLGLGKGDRIAILSQTCPQVVATYLAAAKAGLVIVPLHTGLVAREIEFMLGDVGARAVLVGEEAAAAVGGTLAKVPSIEHRICFGSAPGFTDYDALLRAGSDADPVVAVDDGDLFAIRFTSGTTGLPKGCPSTHRDWLRRSMNTLAHVPHTQHDRALMIAPLSLGVGSSMMMTDSIVGAAMVLQPRFDPADVLETIARERITTLMMPVPTLFARLLDNPGMAQADLSSLRLVGYGGAVFPL